MSPWAKIDDRFHEHRKVRRAWHACPAAVGLHVLALAYCSCHGTNGYVDPEFVAERLPRSKDRTAAVDALTAAGMWMEDDRGGWWMHDFLDYNPAGVDAEAARARISELRSAAGKKGAAARWSQMANGKPDGKPVAKRCQPARQTDGPVPVPDNPEMQGSTSERHAHASASADGASAGVEPSGKGLRVVNGGATA